MRRPIVRLEAPRPIHIRSHRACTRIEKLSFHIQSKGRSRVRVGLGLGAWAGCLTHKPSGSPLTGFALLGDESPFVSDFLRKSVALWSMYALDTHMATSQMHLRRPYILRPEYLHQAVHNVT
jgi:hypothetical protein